MSKIIDSAGNLRYIQLIALVKCVLSLSYGNSYPERGFSLDNVRCTWYDHSSDAIIALRIIKDKLHKVGGVNNCKITRKMIDSCGNARSKQQAAEERIEKIRKEETKLKKKKMRKMLTHTPLLGIATKLKVAENNIKGT